MQQLAALLAQDDGTGEWSTPDAAAITAGADGEDRTLEVPHKPLGFLGPHDETLGRFRLLELLGEGGQGAVYRARDTASGSIVALKVLRIERAARPEALRRFRKEARLLAEANNPHVVNLLEFNEDDRVPYLVLEFVAGRNLGDLITEQTRLDEASALEIMADVARRPGRPSRARASSIATSSPPTSCSPIRTRPPSAGLGDDRHGRRAGRRAAGDDRGVSRTVPRSGSSCRTSGWPGTWSTRSRWR